MTEYVTVDACDGVATIRLARPPVNAVTLQVLRELDEVVRHVGADPAVAAVIMYGGEKVFAAGDDLEELTALSPAALADRERWLDVLAQVPRPVVAAITGYALGGGLELAVGADRRIVGDNVKLGLPQVRAGAVPGVRRVASLIGPSRAGDLAMTGRFVDAAEAHTMGLVDEVVPPDDVYLAARSWAEQFIGGSVSALAAIKAQRWSERSRIGSDR